MLSEFRPNVYIDIAASIDELLKGFDKTNLELRRRKVFESNVHKILMLFEGRSPLGGDMLHYYGIEDIGRHFHCFYSMKEKMLQVICGNPKAGTSEGLEIILGRGGNIEHITFVEYVTLKSNFTNGRTGYFQVKPFTAEGLWSSQVDASGLRLLLKPLEII